MNMNKERKILKERLERIFPEMVMMLPTTLFNDEKDCSPEHLISWYEFLEKLEQNGLEIINTKQK